MNGRYWRIRGYDSTKLIFEKRIKLGHFTEDAMRRLLQTLAAKEGLSYGEIVGAYARRRTLISNDLLEVHKDPSQPTWMCGSNPYFVASVVDEQGKIIRPPSSERNPAGDGEPLPRQSLPEEGEA